MTTREIGKYINTLKRITNFTLQELTSIQNYLINKEYTKFMIEILTKITSTKNDLLLFDSFYFLLGENVPFINIFMLETKLKAIDIPILDKIRIFQDFQQQLDKNEYYTLSYIYLSSVLQLQLDKINIQKVSNVRTLAQVPKSVLDLYVFQKQIYQQAIIKSEEIDMDFLRDLRLKQASESVYVDVQILQNALFLLDFTWDVYFLKPINEKVLLMNFSPQPLKPAFQVFIHEKQLIIAIRGTTNLADHFTNAQSDSIKIQISGDDVYFHSGFYKAAHFIMSNVLVLAHYLVKRGFAEQLTFAGHSQGAAVGCICTALAQKAGFDAQCVGFATPPCCSATIANCCNFVLENDPIPRMSNFYQKTEIVNKITKNEFSPEEIGVFIQQSSLRAVDDFFVPGDVIYIKNGQFHRSSRFGINIGDIQWTNFQFHKLEGYRDALRDILGEASQSVEVVQWQVPGPKDDDK
ncbi:Lipase class 3 family protein [Spironucleus salmonicida]|uniref:Lipase class 3 family protein n=1 Tax=Spironucleus salmonicida TaxID=348837 RepID=V6LT93_9EUKA|nr:Lipase class 3 family protein [Spironucleus salmonicida]|eukprot:EST47478.1 Lipase class 3 family protein [Spironucleus salmonicida]